MPRYPGQKPDKSRRRHLKLVTDNTAGVVGAAEFGIILEDLMLESDYAQHSVPASEGSGAWIRGDFRGIGRGWVGVERLGEILRGVAKEAEKCGLRRDFVKTAFEEISGEL